MGIEYRVLAAAEEKAAHKAAVMTLFERAFARPLPEVDWQHFIVDSPYEPGRCVVAVDGDRVVGTANLVPQQVTIRGSACDYVLFTTSIVDPDYRKRGVYLDTVRLAIQTARAANKRFILAFPNEVALRPLTVLFPFKRIADIPILSGSPHDIGMLRALNPQRSIHLDENFIRWRFTHRPYFRAPFGEHTLVCKTYLDGTDVAEVVAEPLEGLRERLPERAEPLQHINVSSARCVQPGPHQVLTTLHATCCLLTKDIDASEIDLSLLMWDVV
jgi:GNAT acetyltransferase-like protein